MRRRTKSNFIYFYVFLSCNLVKLMGLLYSSKIIYYQSIRNYQENINGKQQAKRKMLELDVLGRFSLSCLMWIENEASFEVYASV